MRKIISTHGRSTSRQRVYRQKKSAALLCNREGRRQGSGPRIVGLNDIVGASYVRDGAGPQAIRPDPTAPGRRLWDRTRRRGPAGRSGARPAGRDGGAKGRTARPCNGAPRPAGPILGGRGAAGREDRGRHRHLAAKHVGRRHEGLAGRQGALDGPHAALVGEHEHGATAAAQGRA